MLHWLKDLFRPGAPSSNPRDPTYVPRLKAKRTGAQHPLVAAKAAQPRRGTARGVGIVYNAAGEPKITKDWLDHLSPADRAAADANLATHGWTLRPDNTIVRT